MRRLALALVFLASLGVRAQQVRVGPEQRTARGEDGPAVLLHRTPIRLPVFGLPHVTWSGSEYVIVTAGGTSWWRSRKLSLTPRRARPLRR